MKTLPIELIKLILEHKPEFSLVSEKWYSLYNLLTNSIKIIRKYDLTEYKHVLVKGPECINTNKNYNYLELHSLYPIACRNIDINTKILEITPQCTIDKPYICDNILLPSTKQLIINFQEPLSGPTFIINFNTEHLNIINNFYKILTFIKVKELINVESIYNSKLKIFEVACSHYSEEFCNVLTNEYINFIIKILPLTTELLIIHYKKLSNINILDLSNWNKNYEIITKNTIYKKIDTKINNVCNSLCDKNFNKIEVSSRSRYILKNTLGYHTKQDYNTKKLVDLRELNINYLELKECTISIIIEPYLRNVVIMTNVKLKILNNITIENLYFRTLSSNIEGDILVKNLYCYMLTNTEKINYINKIIISDSCFET